MILDKIENSKLYYSLAPRVKSAFKYVETSDFSKIEDGVYEIEDGVFAIVSRYETKDKLLAKLESHRKYIDLQFLYEGEELFGYAPLAAQKIIEDYNSDKDLMFYDSEMEYIKLEESSFAIFFPTDLHAPGVLVNDKKRVLKVVVKIAI